MPRGVYKRKKRIRDDDRIPPVSDPIAEQIKQIKQIIKTATRKEVLVCPHCNNLIDIPPKPLNAAW